MIKEKNYLNQKFLNDYLRINLKKSSKILVSISCGIDSTVLFKLLSNSKFFPKKNIYFIIFDHQKRDEGKYEIKEFIKVHKIPKSQLFLRKINLKKVNQGFQEQSRLIRHKYIKTIAKKNKIKDVFLGHHLDDLIESFFMRKIQQSGIHGLSNIFQYNINDLNIHRPLQLISKKQIEYFAKKNQIQWFEDRSNLELDYTRNKIRNFLEKSSASSKVHKERLAFNKINHISVLKKSYIIEISKKKFQINFDKFNKLNKTLKVFIISSFYSDSLKNTKKGARIKNIENLIKSMGKFSKFGKEVSIFGGKLSGLNKKMYINLN